MYGPAHELIESIDEVLQDWSSAALLLRQREAVREHLGDDEARMENFAELGDIYSSIGETAAADRAFEEALAIAQRENDRGAICEIYLVMGYRYWEHDDIAEAREHFHRALALAEDEEDDRSRARALEGLADCDQQGSRYAEAFTKAEEALTIALANETDRVVDLALKLTRWRAECGELTRAAERLTVADLATDAFEVSRRGEYLNGRADLLLYRGRQQDAVREAQRAVAEAEERSDPESLLQSLTTLALAHLYQGDDASADQQITRAMRYWSSGHQLETPALRALIAFRAGQVATAGDFFARLTREAQARIDLDEQDSWAWDYRGLAHCFGVASGRLDETDPARAAFRQAATDPAELTRGRNCRVAFLVGQLAARADRPADLLPVLDDLAVSRPCPPDRPS
jgi:tetratricopeptide (TPR) repeat protein